MINNNKAVKSVNVHWFPFERDGYGSPTSLRHYGLYNEEQTDNSSPPLIIRGKTGWNEYDLVHYQVFLTLSPASLDEPLPESFSINYQLSAYASNTPPQEQPRNYFISSGSREFHITMS